MIFQNLVLGTKMFKSKVNEKNLILRVGVLISEYQNKKKLGKFDGDN